MKRLWWLMTFLSMASLVQGQTHGGIGAQTEQGRLERLESWWQPTPDWQGRWWWTENTGSAWVRAGALQVGPLFVYSGGEGWRSWSPGKTLSSGYWGVGLDQEVWGVWAVQRPDNLESGAQLKAKWGPWTLAGGGDRTWLLDPEPNDIPWVDRARVGLTYQAGRFSSGVESTTFLPVRGPSTWLGRGRIATTQGPWSWNAKASHLEGAALPDREAWTLDLQAGWKRWKAGWSGKASDRDGRFEGSWEESRCGAAVSWGQQKGWKGRGTYSTEWGEYTLGAQAEAEWDGHRWTTEEGLSAAGQVERGRWMGSWLVESPEQLPLHTVTANWKEVAMEFEAQWKVHGYRLGWFGPGNTFVFKMNWFF